jgi:hypothetical protein
VRRDIPIPVGPGPADYFPDPSIKLTNPTAPVVNFKDSPERPNPEINPNNGPGTYNDGRKFGDDSEWHRIGVRREIPIPAGPGPADYFPDPSIKLTNPTAPVVSFKDSPERPNPAINPNNGPGTYNDGRKFGDDSEWHRIGVRREIPIPAGPGPADYFPDPSIKLTNPTAPVVSFKDSPERPNPAINPNNGPGTYNDGRKFGDDSEWHRIGVRREIPIPAGPGPADYFPEPSIKLTNPTAPVVNFKDSPERPNPAINPNNGPGTYDDGRRFGDNSEWHKIGVRREIPIPEGPGPADYFPDPSIKLTNPTASVVNFKDSPVRPNPIINPNNGPGTYDDGRNFGDDSEWHRIGVRREIPIPAGPGPADYFPDPSIKLTNPTAPVPNFKDRPERPNPIINPNNGPGTYDDGRNFGDDSEWHRIGVRREIPIPSGPGPADYFPDPSIKHTNPTPPIVNFKDSPERPNIAVNPNNGPGTYDDGRKFGDDAEWHRIGVRREIPIPAGPGPADYFPDPSIKLTNPTAPVVNFKDSPERPNPLVNPNNGPGTYDDGR